MITFLLRRMVQSTVIVAGEERIVKEPVDFEMCYDPKDGSCWFVGANKTPFAISDEMVAVITQK